jgi:HlyD family secretion protein
MRRILILALLAVGAAAGALVWMRSRPAVVGGLVLYGNVELRQVEVSFNHSERIAEVLVEEGDRVRRGQLLARLDTSRLEPQVAQAEALLAAQREVVARLRSGTRPEEIEQAKANLESAAADLANARQQYHRVKQAHEASGGRAVREQDLDNARTAVEVAAAKRAVSEKALALAIAGPRKEEIAEAEARLRAQAAQLRLLRQQLADSRLLAPADATVRTRILEPGELASPQKPVLSLAITDPKWVRAYVGETNLGRIAPGMPAAVTVDSFPGRRFEGWIGFVSPVAEFTPKTVQTEELRTALVYEVRVFVKDPGDELRLGMPATVRVLNEEKRPAGEKGAEP